MENFLCKEGYTDFYTWAKRIIGTDFASKRYKNGPKFYWTFPVIFSNISELPHQEIEIFKPMVFYFNHNDQCVMLGIVLSYAPLRIKPKKKVKLDFLSTQFFFSLSISRLLFGCAYAKTFISRVIITLHLFLPLINFFFFFFFGQTNTDPNYGTFYLNWKLQRILFLFIWNKDCVACTGWPKET